MTQGGKEEAVALALALDRSAIVPGAREVVHLVAEIRAQATGIDAQRPPMSLVFVLDVSGSMGGPPIEQVALSVDRIVGLLDPTDRVAVVAFSDSASEVCPLRNVDAETRRILRARVHRLAAGGHTNVEAGLRLAAAVLPPRPLHERQVIVLLSDGAPNVGASTQEALADLARSIRPDAAVSTLGFGAHHHAEVLSAISDAGGGRYHFIAEPAVCELEFAQAIGTQGDVVAEQAELRLRPAPGIDIARLLGKLDLRYGAEGLVVALPDLLEGGRQIVVAQATVEARKETGPWEIFEVALSYRRAGKAEVARLEGRVVLDVTAAGGALAPAAHASVLLVQSEEARAAARTLADRGNFEAAAAHLRALMKIVEEAPGFVRDDGSSLAEAYEVLLDEATAYERKPAAEQYEVFRRTGMELDLAGQPAAASMPRFQSAWSRSVMAVVTGPVPDAHLVVLSGSLAGKQMPLGPVQVVGRTKTADIQIGSSQVSRRHTRIFARDGAFWVQDLGSTNTTEVNGQMLDRLHKLIGGDVIRMGDVEVRFVED
ncbi:MAG: VWA domain-containing protein [Deltaproteobacteria bacterium]|nr:VWA domain-containing protein [Deltaproteobacteria bacterium]